MMQINMPEYDYDNPQSYMSLVNAMTNHERNLWARAGYPGQKQKSARAIAEFCPATVNRRTGYVSLLNG